VSRSIWVLALGLIANRPTKARWLIKVRPGASVDSRISTWYVYVCGPRGLQLRRRLKRTYEGPVRRVCNVHRTRHRGTDLITISCKAPAQRHGGLGPAAEARAKKRRLNKSITCLVAVDPSSYSQVDFRSVCQVSRFRSGVEAEWNRDSRAGRLFHLVAEARGAGLSLAGHLPWAEPRCRRRPLIGRASVKRRAAMMKAVTWGLTRVLRITSEHTSWILSDCTDCTEQCNAVGLLETWRHGRDRKEQRGQLSPFPPNFGLSENCRKMIWKSSTCRKLWVQKCESLAWKPILGKLKWEIKFLSSLPEVFFLKLQCLSENCNLFRCTFSANSRKVAEWTCNPCSIGYQSSVVCMGLNQSATIFTRDSTMLRAS